MKQLTIKKKITLWYTGIIAVVLGTILVLVLLFLDKVGISATEEEIIAAVTGFSSNINFQDDSFYLDGDTEFYDDGIMFCIYDKNGRLLYGFKCRRLRPYDTDCGKSWKNDGLADYEMFN